MANLFHAVLVAVVVLVLAVGAFVIMLPPEERPETCAQKPGAMCSAGEVISCANASNQFVSGTAKCRAEPSCDPGDLDCCNWDLSECSREQAQEPS